MKVAQHPGFAGSSGLAQQIAPHRDEIGAHLLGRLRPAVRQIPFEHQSDLDQKRVGVEGRDRIGELWRKRQGFGQGLPMQSREQVGCGLITFGDRCGWIAFDKTRDAEILADQKSAVEVGVMDGWRREAAGAQALSIATQGLTSSARCTAALYDLPS
jgi:hypothetical protein